MVHNEPFKPDCIISDKEYNHYTYQRVTCQNFQIKIYLITCVLADLCEIPCFLAFIWVFILCQRSYLGVSSIQIGIVSER